MFAPMNRKIKAVLFVPRSEKGELLSRLKEEEAKLADITGYRVKLVESSGTQLSRILCQRNPWAGEDCTSWSSTSGTSCVQPTSEPK